MARDERRIPIVLDELRRFWEKHPDWRLGQIVSNVVGRDPFYIEDEAFVAALLKLDAQLEEDPDANPV